MFVFAWLVPLVVAACDDVPLNRITGRALSPLPPVIDLRLVTKIWEIVDVVHQDEPVPFDGVPHFQVYFQWKGVSAIFPVVMAVASKSILRANTVIASGSIPFSW